MGETSETLPSKPKIEMFGVPMHPWSMEETLAAIGARLDRRERTQHVVVNVAKVVTMLSDPTLKAAVIGCDIINIDGMGLVFGARFLGLGVPERVAGIDLFIRLLAMAEQRGESVFLLGAKEDVLEKAVANLRARFPALHIAGWHHGYFWGDEEAVVAKISASGARMLFVAITSPKKEQFIARWGDKLGATFMMGVGGTFDVVAGITKRAPVWMQAAGLEWFFRLAQEPGRMWKRYLTTNLRFAVLLLSQRFRWHTNKTN